MLSFQKICYLCMIVICYSCTKPIDVDQLDNASFDSSFILTLVHVNLKAPDFLDDLNQEIPVTSDVIQGPSLDDLHPYLKRVEFTVKTTNSFDRNFTLSILFFDENKNIIYTLQPVITVPLNSDELTYLLEIPEKDVNIIYSTYYFGMQMSLWNSETGDVIKFSDSSEFNLKSAMKLYFNLRKV